jgi:hypothetical protein
MARAYGSSAHLHMKRETFYGRRRPAIISALRRQTVEESWQGPRPRGDWQRTVAELQSEWPGRSLPVGCCPGRRGPLARRP